MKSYGDMRARETAGPRASIDLRKTILAASGFARRAFLLERAQSSTVSPDFAEHIFDPSNQVVD
jgi:hypothetical protein